MSEWREGTLGDVLTLQRGFDLPARDREEGSVPVVSSSGVTGRHSVAKVDPPGVVIGRYGSLGSVHWVEEPFWPLNTALWVKDFKGNDPRYVRYLLETIQTDSGAAAAVPGVNRNHLHRLEVRIPLRPTQQKIASTLAAVDGLISINQRRIEHLSRLGWTLYRRWFEFFRFPGGHGTLVRSSVGDIPRDWEVQSLGDVCVVMRAGSTPSRSDPANWDGGGISWFKTGELRDGPLTHAVESIVERPGVRLFEPPMILMAIYGAPTVGRLGWVTQTCSCNQAALGMRTRDPEVLHEWLWFQLIALRDSFNAMAQGAAQQNISKEKVRQTSIAVPPDRVVAAFSERAGAWRARWHSLELENATLRRIRALLLPRLVSGRLDISDVDLGDLISDEKVA